MSDTRIVNFTIWGDPRGFALKRARATSRGGFVRMHDHPANVSAKDEIKAALLRECPPNGMLDSPLRLELGIYTPIPKSFSQKKARLAIEGTIRPTTRPDVSNIIKCVEDALNAVLYRDDSQICDIVAYKRYSEKPRLEVVVDEVQP